MLRNLKNLILPLCAITVLASQLFGQMVRDHSKTAPPPKDTPRLVKFNLKPQPEPTEALKYQFRHRYIDQTPGNAAPLYHMAIHLLDDTEKNDSIDKIEEWLEMPLEEIPRDKVRAELDKFHTVLRQFNLATHREYCNWDLPVRTEGFSLLLPSLSDMKKLGKILAYKAHFQIIEGQIDASIETLTNGYTLARHIADGPTLIESLVGIAITGLMNHQVERLVQATDAPNLYWALADLPTPFIDPGNSIEMERDIFYIEFPHLRDISEGIYSPERLTEMVSETLSKVQELGGSLDISFVDDMAGKLALTGWTMLHYPAAKEYLLNQGKTVEQINAMPAVQAVMIYQLGEYEKIRDSIFKWFSVPYWQAREGMKKAESVFKIMDKGIRTNPFLAFLPALSKAYFVTNKIDRQIAALRCVEAIRNYAATHNGKLPTDWSDITEMPIPLDPITGKNFTYKVTNKTATLEALAPQGESRKQGFIYEITIKTKK